MAVNSQFDTGVEIQMDDKNYVMLLLAVYDAHDRGRKHVIHSHQTAKHITLNQ